MKLARRAAPLAFLALFTACGWLSPPRSRAEGPFPEPFCDKTAYQYFEDEGIRVGWNIGNTLDAWNSTGSAEDVNWGNPRVCQALLDGVKEAGFNLVRVPITWKGHIGPAPDYLISERFLRRVAEVIAYARDAGLKVIINLHHDGSTQGGGRDNGWLSIGEAANSKEGYGKVYAEFSQVWAQISAYFRDYGDYLIFEAFNELHDGAWGWGDEAKQRLQYPIINELNQLFTDTVRDSGGNNGKRYLIVTGYSAAAKHTLANYFTLPVDRIPDRQIVSFHYYDPYEFGIAGTRADWGTNADRLKLDIDFAPFKKAFIDRKIPVIIGESGAVRQLYPGDEAKTELARAARLHYLACVYEKSVEYGLIPVYWDNGATAGTGEKFGLFDRSSGKPNSEESAALIRAMIDAVKI